MLLLLAHFAGQDDLTESDIGLFTWDWFSRCLYIRLLMASEIRRA